MFQNLAEDVTQVNEDVKVNNQNNFDFERFKDVFRIQNIIIYILSFLISTVSIRDGLAPFGLAFFVAACSSTIPAGPVLITTLIGTFISQGASGVITYILSILIFLLMNKYKNI